MNSSFLLTSNKRFDGNSYLIPNQMQFTAIRLKSAIINFSEKNVVGHRALLRVSHINETTPHSQGQVFEIPDGSYTPEQYAKTLENALNKIKTLDSADNVATDSDLYKPPVTWEIQYNPGSGNFEFYAQISSSYDYNVYLSFNEPASDYTGLPFGQNLMWERYGGEQHVVRTPPRPVLALPRYFRVCSNQLAQFGFNYDNSMGSNIIGIVPIDYSRKWSSWENHDNFFHARANNDIILQSLLDIEIFLEESIHPIQNPDFVLVFQLQA